MSVTLDATVGSSNNGASSSLTFSHTTSGLNRALVVDVASYDSCTSVTYNGVGMTKQTEATYGAGTVRISQWYLVAPATGANNVVVTCSDAHDIAANATSYNGVHQTTPINTSNTGGTDGGTSYTVSVTTTVANTMLCEALCNINGLTMGTLNGGQTTLGTYWSAGSGRGVSGSYKVATSSGSNSMGRTGLNGGGTEPAAVIALTSASEAFVILDTTTMVETTSTIIGKSFTILDTFTLTDIFTSIRSRFFTILDSFTLSDSLSFLRRWPRQTKNTATLSNQSKNSSTVSVQSKNSSTLINQTKHNSELL